MNTPKLPPLPKPDTHCFDEDTGKDVWSHSPEQMQAYATAATDPLLQRIAELEQNNRDLSDDVQRFRKHAMNEKAARMELERQLEEARKQMEVQKDEWLAWEAKRKALEKDAERYRWLRRWKGQEHEPPFTVQHELDGTLWGGDLDAAIDAAMQKDQS